MNTKIGLKRTVAPVLLLTLAILTGCASSQQRPDRTLAGDAASNDEIYLVTCWGELETTRELLDFHEARLHRGDSVEADHRKVLKSIERLAPDLAKALESELKRMDRYEIYELPGHGTSTSHQLPAPCKLRVLTISAIPEAMIKIQRDDGSLGRHYSLAKAELNEITKRGILLHHLIRERDPQKESRSNSRAYRTLNGALNSTQLDQQSEGQFAHLLQELGLSR
jgi:hypothetical protein